MAATSASGDKKSPQDIVQGFQKLREEQRAIALKLHELEGEKSEHRLVTQALDKIEGGRRCYRMIGGVLVERTVKEVLPALKTNRDQIEKLMETLTKQLEEKGTELNSYRDKYGIRVRGEDSQDDKPSKDDSSEQKGSGSVLVAEH